MASPTPCPKGPLVHGGVNPLGRVSIPAGDRPANPNQRADGEDRQGAHPERGRGRRGPRRPLDAAPRGDLGLPEDRGEGAAYNLEVFSKV